MPLLVWGGLFSDLGPEYLFAALVVRTLQGSLWDLDERSCRQAPHVYVVAPQGEVKCPVERVSRAYRFNLLLIVPRIGRLNTLPLSSQAVSGDVVPSEPSATTGFALWAPIAAMV